ncbi:MAG: AAA family ATPase [Defluviitaleaceae bacterium]|nr:AAA family ATPase [Defluviitaleaceae bacterium]
MTTPQNAHTDNHQFEGTVENVIFHSEDSGYSVFILRIDDESDPKDAQLSLAMYMTEEEGCLTCTGHFPNLYEGERLHINGRFVNHARYGWQLAVGHARRLKPTGLASIERYLGSGIIKGLGERTAKRIVARFGAETFDIIANEPERLASLRGISEKMAYKFSEAFHAQTAQRQAILFLQEYGITPGLAMRIYKKYGDETVELVRSNPFRLADDIDGIGFKTADAIARRLGCEINSAERISAGVRYLLWEASNEGHTYLPQNTLIQQACTLLNVQTPVIENELIRMQMERLIIREVPRRPSNTTTNEADEPYVFVSALYYAERGVAQMLNTLTMASAPSRSPTELNAEAAPVKNDLSPHASSWGNTAINNDPAQIDSSHHGGSKGAVPPSRGSELRSEVLSFDFGIALSPGQAQAIAAAMTQGVLVITGGPGTGKTTVINTLIGLLERNDNTVVLAAPTGRAAKRITEATGREAKTLHRLLEVNFISEDARRVVFNRNDENPLECDVLIVDEASMIDTLLMNSLLKAVALGTRLILVGDVDQLPSVGPGSVLRDIIDSGAVAVVRLTEIFRQAQESAIITNAHRVNQGQYPATNEREKDFFFVQRNNIDAVAETVVDLVINRLPAYLPGEIKDIKTDIQVLTPMRKSNLGVNHLNTLLQARLNPPAPNKNERESGATLFRTGDKVMQIRNNYDAAWELLETASKSSARPAATRPPRIIDRGTGVYNGDMGIITSIDEENLTVLFDDNRRVVYEFSQLDDLELAYAVTVHKSQGSEYKVVIIPLYGGPPMLLTRNLLYTAITRARTLCVLVGLPDTMHRMVDNNRVTRRYTALTLRLQELAEMRDMHI